jgi:lysozyme
MTRQIGHRGLDLIKQFEGCKLTAYVCPAGVLTIGYGSTGPHVKRGMTITEAGAENLLRDDLARFEAAVNRHAPTTTQSQFDALTSFAFNCGIGALQSSTLLRKHNAGDYAGAQAQFARWNKGGGRVLAGLSRRRKAEAALYGAA